MPGPTCLARDPCKPTPLNPEGPYYRAGAPDRTEFNVNTRPGTPMVLSGRVESGTCGAPVSGAVLDLWHADGDGVYDLDTPDFALRGRVTTDADGRYAVRSVQPGAYFFGGQPRARHIHVRLTAAGHVPLTTQLYFPDDPMRAFDVQYACGLDVDVQQTTNVLMCSYNFVMRAN